jgi:hypothetical protein
LSYSTRRQKGDYRWVPECQGIYRLYHGDYIIYQGETKNLARRLQQHEQEKNHWGTYDYQTTYGCKTITRKKIEKRAIRYNKPSRNVTHRNW